ncbi:glycosyltransferase [Rubripirellula amarantea]|uniref:sucrose-phosphate synthase n=1 Tax=Rubripirellula amarantea TaxID=2527999 RepID=A0A5C5WS11_9BACT|nr:HAD family hydrolase [Rubripirellula amarantea]MDA8745521.1 glycosyltransferase [Rubripirellula amarantea]TWT53694.1 Mannosylfructose-phosphate synthase [Rubripirellula amarantea]
MSLFDAETPLKVSLISLHGLVRGHDLELGKDVDTGGQIKYVIELARELAAQPEIGSVELLTRQIIDPRYHEDYAKVEEPIAENAKIVRIPFGPKRYIRKEALWPYLEMFVDQALVHFRRSGIPDLIHAHYADAGQAGSQLARLLHVPFVFTGHSLGRVKRQRLIADQGEGKAASMDKKYKFQTRIEAEELALETASMVVTSTNQEVELQYELYDHYAPDRMEVIPPGVDLEQFWPPNSDAAASGPQSDAELPAIVKSINRFLVDSAKPMILAMARPDERKNLCKLVEVYGESAELQSLANLVLIMGTHDDIDDLPKAQAKIINDVWKQIDRFDLYGKVAYPKTHQPSDVPELYRHATSLGGVFVNAALTEPFGLTLLEAGATGLPIVATNDGGPRDIIANCENGLLVDPLDGHEIENALLRVLTEPENWKAWSQAGIAGTRKHYAWHNHARRYIRDLDDILRRSPVPALILTARQRRLPQFDRIIVTDLDNTLTGDEDALRDFTDLIANNDHIGFGIATGRRLDSAMALIEELNLPRPDVIDTDAGTQLHYGPTLTPDLSWRKQIGFAWQPEQIRAMCEQIPGLELQSDIHQSEYKISYLLNTEISPSVGQLKKKLREAGLRARVIISLDAYLDIVPVRGGSDFSMRHLLYKWGFSPEKMLVAGDSGNDAGMIMGRTLGVVVANHDNELERLRGKPRIYFAETSHARGVLEGIEYYNFLENIRIPNDSIDA